MSRSRTDATAPARRRRGSRLLRLVGWLNIWLMCAVWGLLWAIGETNWIGTVLTYAPRSLLCLPAAVLAILSLRWDRRAVLLHLMAMGVVIGPIMDFVVPVQRLLDRTEPKGPRLRVITCNVQGFGEGFEARLQEIVGLKPDLLVLQEASQPYPALDEAFGGWHFAEAGNLRVGSRFPVRLLADLHIADFDRRAAIIVEVETPVGTIHVADIHQMTPRPGLENFSREKLSSGEWGEQIQEWENRRRKEMRALRRAVDGAAQGRPHIYAGDFNSPSTSPIFRNRWGDQQNAFTHAGWGWGYTAPCAKSDWWPADLPWVRIDHILCSRDWRVLDCRAGTSGGSDHRLVVADLLLLTP